MYSVRPLRPSLEAWLHPVGIRRALVSGCWPSVALDFGGHRICPIRAACLGSPMGHGRGWKAADAAQWLWPRRVRTRARVCARPVVSGKGEGPEEREEEGKCRSSPQTLKAQKRQLHRRHRGTAATLPISKAPVLQLSGNALDVQGSPALLAPGVSPLSAGQPLPSLLPTGRSPFCWDRRPGATAPATHLAPGCKGHPLSWDARLGEAPTERSRPVTCLGPGMAGGSIRAGGPHPPPGLPRPAPPQGHPPPSGESKRWHWWWWGGHFHPGRLLGQEEEAG